MSGRPVRLADLTTLRLGGPVGRLVEARTEAELVDAVRVADDAREPLLVLGGGSNLVAPDAGFPGTVVAVRTRGIVEGRVRPDGTVELRVAAGEPWEDLVAATVARGLAGLEALSGIPGSTGATPLQNVGAYGSDVAQTITTVRAYDRARRRVVEVANADCGFGYRTSRFRGSDREVVLDVGFALRPGGASAAVAYPELARRLGVRLGEPAAVADVRSAVLDLRRGKGMVLDADDLDTWSVGSFFTNPVLDAGALPDGAPGWPQPDGRVKTSAAWLIQRAGFERGHPGPGGRVALSSKHPLALTHRGGGTTADLLALAREVRDGVRDRFGVELHPEPVLLDATL